MTRWLLHGNDPRVGSGYGTQMAHLAEMLASMYGRENIAISAFHGAPFMTEWHGLPVYPAGQDAYGGDIVGMHAGHFGADIVLTLMDNWALNHQTLLGRHHVAWTPVDCSNPDNPATSLGLHDLNRLMQNPATVVIAMSRFGYDVVQSAKEHLLLPNRLFYVPHMIDMDVFRPVDPATRTAIRQGLKADDRFVLLTVAANRDKSRKNMPHMARAVLRALKGDLNHKPCKDLLWALHTEESNPRGHDLKLTLARVGLPKEAYRFSHQYAMAIGAIPDWTLAGSMAAADAGYQASLAEGFGLPNAEEMSCGTPVISTAGSSMSEVVGKGGWLVKAQPHWAVGHESYWAEPDHDALVRAIRDAYAKGKSYQAKKAAARPHIEANYELGLVRDTHWAPTLKALHDHFGIDDDRRFDIAS